MLIRNKLIHKADSAGKRIKNRNLQQLYPLFPAKFSQVYKKYLRKILIRNPPVRLNIHNFPTI